MLKDTFKRYERLEKSQRTGYNESSASTLVLTSVRFSFYYDTVHVVRVGDVDDTDWRTKCDSHVSISGISISGAFCLPSSSEKICTYSLSDTSRKYSCWS
jgi:hypothetical protein